MKRSLLTSALIVALSSSTVFAHSDKHQEKKKFDLAQAEQKEFGKAGDPKKVTRTVTLEMSDKMRFTPDSIEVTQGDTVKFILVNHGNLMHEMVIGTMKELKAHAELMKKFPDMEHEEPHMAHVKPGKTGEIVWTFNKPGEFNFACLIAGHFEAGMLGKVKVVGQDGHAHGH